jgi:hypothetical protein
MILLRFQDGKRPRDYFDRKGHRPERLFQLVGFLTVPYRSLVQRRAIVEEVLAKRRQRLGDGPESYSDARYRYRSHPERNSRRLDETHLVAHFNTLRS